MSFATCERCGHEHTKHMYRVNVPTDCGHCECPSFVGTIHGRRYNEPSPELMRKWGLDKDDED